MYYHSDELYHYGVLGQKWGVRRYQNADGTLTAEGRNRIKAENKKAFELGRTATIYGRASEIGQKKMIKTENKMDKWAEKHPGDDGSNSSRMQRLQKKWMNQAETTVSLAKKAAQARDAAEKHCKELIEKYGEENVKPISYKTEYNNRIGAHSVMNERVVSGKEIASSILMTAGAVGLSAAVGAPVTMVFTPSTKQQRASRVYDQEYAQQKKKRF